MMRANKLILSLSVLCGAACAQNIITTFAGTDWTFKGDGKPALSAYFKQPSAITVDPQGNPVVVDGYVGIVIRINPDGTLTLLAGNGFNLQHGDVGPPNDSGDNGPAISASLSNPVSVAFDRQGNLYIGELGQIRKVSTTGIITTIAGARKLGEGFSGDGGPAVDAQIYTIGGLAADAAGNIYLGDGNNNRVRKIDTNGIITTFAGNGVQGFSGDGGRATAASLNAPRGVAVDGNGDLYIADSGNNCVRKVTPAGLITTVVPSSVGNLNPFNLALDNSGVLYIGGYFAVFKLPRGATLPQLIAGSQSGRAGFSGDNGPAIAALLNAEAVPVATDGRGNLFLADEFNYRVRKIANDVITTVAGVGAFPADKVPARDVPLSFPHYAAASPTIGLAGGLAFDGFGNLFASEPDNNRVLKISPDGVVTTFAGTGTAGNSGNNGPAAQATLNAPSGLAFYAGSLYIADSANGIRRVTPDGTITAYSGSLRVNALAFDKAGNLFATCEGRVCKIDTNRNVTIVAGTGVYGNSGDGGPAIRATFGFPSGIAVDGKGNIYVADYWNSRVRVVTPDGNISAYAGTGVSECGCQTGVGDNGPAAQALFGQPTGLLLDPSGNLYIADSYYGTSGRVRVVSPSGIITTFAGGGPPDRLGDGMPAPQATLQAPAALAFDSSLNLYVADGGSNRIRQILAKPPAMRVAPASLSLSAASGGAPVTETVSVTGSIGGLEFRVFINSARNWLSADLSADATPRLLTLTADPAGLAPGSYVAVVSIIPVAGMPASNVSVSFQVGEAQPPSLRLDRSEISFTLPQAGPARSSTLLISNGGGQLLSYTATSRMDSGENWLSISPAAGSATPGKASTLTVTANPAALRPGVYTGEVEILTAAGNQNITVILTVSENPRAVLLTQTGLSFTAVAQGGVIPPQSFGVVNAGIGVMDWTAGASTTAGGDWLLISPAGGASDAAGVVPQVTVSVNAAGLAAGKYYGTVRVDAPGTANRSRVLTVFLSVLPAGTAVAASVQPPELVFYATPGGLPPGSQIVNVYNIAAIPRSFTSGRSSDGFALYPLPGNGTLNPSQPTQVVVQPYGRFAAGTTKGALTFQFSDGTAQSVKITVISAPGSGISPSPELGDVAHAASPGAVCTPSQLVVSLHTLSQAFQVSAGWPVGLSVKAVDDCSNPLVAGAGSVWVHFDSGEDDVPLTALGEGTWQGTWHPQNVRPNVTVTINARSGNLPIAQKIVSGAQSAANDRPSFTLNSIGTIFAPPTPGIRPLAPGSFLSIYGSRLSDFSADAVGALPQQLANTQVYFNDLPAPMHHADAGQINVVVPSGVNLNTTSQVRIQRGVTLSEPVAVDIAASQTSILQTNGSAYAVDILPAAGGSSFTVTTSSPASAGDTLVLFGTGLGVTTPPLDDGAVSPASPPAIVAGVTVKIGGQNALLLYAGLAPGYVGLYQLNLVVPSGVTAGAAVPLTVTSGGQTSPVVNLAIR